MSSPFQLEPNDSLRADSQPPATFRVRSLTYAFASLQGSRRTQEDRYIADTSGKLPLFAVLDGHGGDDAAAFGATYLPDLLSQRTADVTSSGNVEAAFSAAFLDLDAEFLRLRQNERDCAGSTVIAATILNGCQIIVANIGDSRAVLCRNGFAIPLSEDHKPSREDESERIRAAGGFVVDDRVVGKLSVSRAIGDSAFKAFKEVECKKYCSIIDSDNEGDDHGQLAYNADLVIANPEIRTVSLTSGDEFLILACDGVWSVMSPQEACDFVRARFAASTESNGMLGSPERDHVARALCETAIQRENLDNTTVVLVLFGG